MKFSLKAIGYLLCVVGLLICSGLLWSAGYEQKSIDGGGLGMVVLSTFPLGFAIIAVLYGLLDLRKPENDYLECNKREQPTYFS